MIVHICNDQKFIDFIIEGFDKFNPNKNIYIVITYESNLKLIKKTNDVIICTPNDNKILDFCNDAKAVILHSFLRYNTVWTYKINSNVKLIWSCWGGGLYNSDRFKKINYNIYEPYANILIEKASKHTSLKQKIIELFPIIYYTYHYYRNGYHHPLYTKNKTLRRIDLIATVIPPEFDLIKKTFPIKSNVSYVDLSYGNLKTFTGNFYNNYVKLGSNILIGNSASYACNHIDCLLRLNDLNVDRKMIFPLSYGNNDYKSILIEKGKKTIGERFIGLTDFLEINDYIQIIKSCSVMIMNHRRQQAVGNIVLGLYLGMRVFLNNKNPVLRYLKNEGVIIFDFQKEFNNNKKSLSQLTNDEIIINRNVLEKIWGEKVVNHQFESLINKIYNG